ncbi:CBO0543 family protein [Tumebacillus flagellatus]|uniref:Uncharacterized protein n=1 Tax=Tumebacillus flagellatus TaxID=1157490 RepID=A0A074M746_9BACL|nr:CBO0543 family protein [Tumebacillus flagellatus]KEO81832.1 hypothetical protein EL26_18495 [Tumebacillus flagellatus]
MSLERWVLVASGVVSLLLWFLLVPRNKIREALMAGFFYQMLGWMVELIVVQMRWVEYPVREFPHATRINYTLFTIAYPTVVMLAVLYAPRTRWQNLLFLLLAGAGLATFADLVEIYTSLSAYRHWNWFASWVAFFMKIALTYVFTEWYRQGLVQEKKAQTP